MKMEALIHLDFFFKMDFERGDGTTLNVFTIAKLRSSGSENSKLQEVETWTKTTS